MMNGYFSRIKNASAVSLIINLMHPIYANPMATPRTDSLPYVSGDTFRCHSKFIFDEDSTFAPNLVMPGDTIFVATTHLNQFFKMYYTKIKNPFILISHNHVYPLPGPFATYLNDAKLYAWFVKNIDRAETDKLHCIPVGLTNERKGKNYRKIISELQPSLFGAFEEAFQKKDTETKLLYANFSIATFPPERQYVYDLFKSKSFCSFERRLPLSEYLKMLKNYKFILSPRGSGLDCIRTWEALYFGCIPIVKSSTLNPLYQDLPILIVDDWRQVTREFLESEYQRIKHGTYKMEKVAFNYWWNIILQYQQRCQFEYQKKAENKAAEIDVKIVK